MSFKGPSFIFFKGGGKVFLPFWGGTFKKLWALKHQWHFWGGPPFKGPVTFYPKRFFFSSAIQKNFPNFLYRFIFKGKVIAFFGFWPPFFLNLKNFFWKFFKKKIFFSHLLGLLISFGNPILKNHKTPKN